jgi:hypothetical protein
MQNAAEKYHLVVSGLMGTVFIAKLTKEAHIMSLDRRKVPPSEFIDAVLQYTLAQLTGKSDTMSITLDGNVVAEVKIVDKKLLKQK